MAQARPDDARERLGVLRAQAERLHAADDPDARREILAHMRAEAEGILADGGPAVDEVVRSRTFLAMAAATFSLAHFSRGDERTGLVESAIASCEHAIAAASRSPENGQADVLAETMATLAASSHVLDPSHRGWVVNLLRRLGDDLASAVVEADDRVALLGRSVRQADVSLSSLLRCGAAPTSTDALAVLEAIARRPGTAALP